MAKSDSREYVDDHRAGRAQWRREDVLGHAVGSRYLRRQAIRGDRHRESADPDKGTFLFDVERLNPPYRPEAYAKLIKSADEAGYGAIVVDQFSHEHSGYGGLLDWHEEELYRLAQDDYGKRERVKFTAWISPKREHKHMIDLLLRTRAHLILCFRAEQKTEMVTAKSGKVEVVAKKTLAGFEDWIPVAEKNFLYEATPKFLLLPDRPGVGIPIKVEIQHQDIFPKGQLLDENAGRRLAAWASGGGAAAPTASPAAPEIGPDATGAPPPDACSECDQSPCAEHCSLQGAEPPDDATSGPEPLDPAITKAIDARVGKLIQSRQVPARAEITVKVRAALGAGRSIDRILPSIAKWEPK